MSMVTTCPHCTTSFNVEAEVLLLRDGRVRCGQCKQIFDGLLSATTLEEFEASAGAPVSGSTSDAAVPDDVVLPPAVPVEDYWPATPDVPEVPAPPIPLEIAAAASREFSYGTSAPGKALDAEVSPLPMPAPITQKSRITHHARDVEPEQDEFDAAHRSEPKSLHRGWAIAATLAALLLAGQVT